MRLFVAVLFPDEMKRDLAKVQDAFRRRGVLGNYTKKENMHLTLAFIGEWPDEEEVLDVMERVSFSSFEMKLQGIGQFKDLWWAGIRESVELEKIARQLRRELAEAGIPFDRKRFSPHITLLRRPVYTRQKELGGVFVPDCSMTVDRISLMRSDRGKDGMIYTEIGSVWAAK